MSTTAISPFVQRTDTQIDWTAHTNGTNDFTRRLADAYLGNTFHSDMTFFVEMDETSIPAHSLIIAAASPVLDRFVWGTGGADGIINTDRIVRVPDCPLPEFNVLLRYLYTGIVEVHTIETATVLLPVAHYFDLRYFEDVCAGVIKKLITPNNVCETYDRIHLMDIPLQKTCIKLMQTNIDKLLSNGSLMRMKDDTVTKILIENLIRVPSENQLFQAMLRWADEQCAIKEIPPTSTNRRLILKNRLNLDRFDGMTSYSFFLCMADVGPGFFSNQEIATTCFRIAMVDKLNDESNVYKRRYKDWSHVTQSNEYNGIEYFLKTKCTKIWSLIGFKSDADIVKISAEKLDKTTFEINYIKIGKWFMFETPPESLHNNDEHIITLHITLLDPLDMKHVRKLKQSSRLLDSSGYYSACTTICKQYMICE